MTKEDWAKDSSSSNGKQSADLLSTVERRIREEAVPQDALQRALAAVRKLRQPDLCATQASSADLGLAAAVAAAVIIGLLLVSIPSPGPQTAWAEVVEAVQEQPWIHGVATDADGNVRQFWFSKQAGLRIFHSAQQVFQYDDGRGICFTYDPSQQTIYRHRVSKDDPDLTSQYRWQNFAIWDEVLPRLFAGHGMVQFPEGPREFISQSQRTVTDARTRLD